MSEAEEGPGARGEVGGARGEMGCARNVPQGCSEERGNGKDSLRDEMMWTQRPAGLDEERGNGEDRPRLETSRGAEGGAW